MKIALVHIRQSEVGGTERYLNQIARHLAEHGHDVHIICRRHELAPHPAARFVVLRSFALGGAWRMWAFARNVEEHVRCQSYDVVFGLGKTWAQDVIRLGGGLHETYLEIAHRATLRPWQRPFAALGVKHRLACAIERRALQPGSCRRVITNSEMVKRDVVRRHGVAADRVCVIYNGVDLDRFHPRLRLSAGQELRRAHAIEPEDFVVLFLGTGYGRKGLDRALDAFPALLRACPRARLLVAGYDSAAFAYQRRAERLGIAGVTRFLGGRRDAEVCFAAADLYLLPTRYDPFASSTLEALACGVPVVTTTTNGASELIEHRRQGSVLSASASLDEWIAELRFWSQDGRTREHAPAARALAEGFSQERTARTTVQVLEAVLAEKR